MNQTNTNVEHDGLLEACKELELFQQVIKKQPNIDAQTASQMFAHSLRMKMKREGLTEKIADVQANPILQQAMQENYVQFTQSLFQAIDKQT